MRSLCQSFLCAIRGVGRCITTSRNFRIHTVCTFYAVMVSLAAGLSGDEVALIVLLCSVVMALEGLNCALEAVCDRISTERENIIRNIKDMAAGAVLISAISSIVVAACLFLRRETLSTLYRFALDNPFYAASIILFIIPCLVYIFKLKLTEKD